MGIRIPRSGDQDVQNAFRDVEQEIEDLKAALASQGGSDPSAELADLKKQVDLIPPAKFDSDENVFVGAGPQHAVGLVPDPGPYTGGNLSLQADGTWGNPDLLKLNDEEQTPEGVQDVYTLPGALHVSGPVQAGPVTAESVHAMNGATVAGDLTVSGVVYGAPRVISAQVDAAASSGTGATDAHLFTIPANTLSDDGDTLVVRCTGTFTANSNTKTWRLFFDGAEVLEVANASGSTSFWSAQAWIRRLSSSSAICIHRGAWYNQNGVGFTSPGAVLDSSVDFTAAIDMKTQVQMATSGTMTETSFTVTLEPAP